MSGWNGGERIGGVTGLGNGSHLLPVTAGLAAECVAEGSTASHHDAILVLEQVAVIHKVPDTIRISKIHAQLYHRINGTFSIPKWDVDGVAQVRLIHRQAKALKEHEMDLMNVECV